MGTAFFYHLTHSSAEATLHMLLPKALAAGWTVELRGLERASMEALDLALWGEGDAFVPHGLAGGPHDAAQPVLLTWDGAADSAARGRACVISLEGAPIEPAEAQAAQRVCILFDGGNEAAVQTARGQWRAMTQAEIAAQYWAQDGGQWVKKSESPAQ